MTRTFADEITRLRISRGWTPSELATRLDKTHAAVWQWEEGRTLPRRALVREIEAIFDIEPGELQQVVDADRIDRRRRITATSPQTKSGKQWTAVSKPKGAKVSIDLDSGDEVDDLIFTSSTHAVRTLARMQANAARISELHAEARTLIDQALADPTGPSARSNIERSQDLFDVMQSLGEANERLRETIDADRSRTLNLIQRTRYVIGEDNEGDDVAPEKIADVVKRRLGRNTSRRRVESMKRYKQVEETSNVWFTPDATPSDAVPLLVLLLDLVNRVDQLEGTVNGLRVDLETERMKQKGKPAIGFAEQHS